MNDILDWAQEWYQSQCDGDWEHTYGIKIGTLDNPGWSIDIDLTGTSLEGLVINGLLVEKSDDDWYIFKVEKSKFIAHGDPIKLTFLLEKFQEIILKNNLH